MPRTFRRTALVLSLALLISQAAVALPLAGRPDGTPVDFMATLWSWFSAQLPGVSRPSTTPATQLQPGLRTKVGATADPNNGQQANLVHSGSNPLHP